MNKLLFIILLSITSLAVALEAYSLPKWVKVAKSIGGYVTVYIDIKSIKRIGTGREFTAKLEESLPEARCNEIISLIIVNCEGDYFNIIRQECYNYSTLAPDSTISLRTKEILKGSIADVMVKYVCNR